jgi:hypothetical protein
MANKEWSSEAGGPTRMEFRVNRVIRNGAPKMQNQIEMGAYLYIALYRSKKKWITEMKTNGSGAQRIQEPVYI